LGYSGRYRNIGVTLGGKVALSDAWPMTTTPAAGGH
jgi:hypothetical protein